MSKVYAGQSYGVNELLVLESLLNEHSADEAVTWIPFESGYEQV
jgi:hypothetical protein